jgi:tetratricopeptide (TPR) repeat protein
MRVSTLVLALAIAFVPVAAHADDQPWAVGVTDAQKAGAQKLLEEGNALFLKKDYAQALEKYKAAVGSWDHPAIRFNMVRCLIQLDRPVEASDSLALALKYGAAPLEEAVYTEALSYQKLLASQIGDLDIKCDQPGVKVTLDGQHLLDCPGKEHRRVSPGQHQLVGTKDGFLTKTTEVVVIGAKTQDASVALIPLGKAAKIVHRYPTWIPWTVFGGGLVVAGFGALIQYDASSTMAAYDRSVSTNCGGAGCAKGDTRIDDNQRQSALTENKIAISVMTVGAATAVVGGVLLYMNRGRTVYEENVVEKTGVAFVPTHDGAAMILSGHF